MATNSITKNVTIRTPRLARSLANALEQAEHKQGKEVIIKKQVRDVKGDEIKKILGDFKE